MESLCFVCRFGVQPPFIHCIECLPKETPDSATSTATNKAVHICSNCFAKGEEIGPHKNGHQYSIVRDDIPVFNKSGWNASQEIKLLDAIQRCGLGNWSDVERLMRRSARECEKHYSQIYLNGQSWNMPAPRALPEEYPAVGLIPSTASSRPPRPSPLSVAYIEMAGYMAARGDFATEYNNSAEHLIRDVEFNSDDDLEYSDLQVTLTDIYRQEVLKRESIKRVIKKHGLLDLSGTDSYFREISRSLTSGLVDVLRRVMRLLGPEEFHKYVLMIKYEAKLKARIKALCRYRGEGITTQRQMHLYEKLSRSRLSMLSKKTAFPDVLKRLQDQETWHRWVVNNQLTEKLSAKTSSMLPVPALSRRAAPPIDLTGLPGAEKLDSEEWQLCSTVRLQPSAYFEFSRLLIAECKKDGFLPLARARTVIKIDVNKTRKLYDFLIERGKICKTPSI